MVRFACFFSPGHNQRPKKVQQLGGTMHSNSRRNSQEQAVRFLSGSGSTNRKADDNYISNKNVEQITSPSTNEDCWKSEDLNGDFCQGDSKKFLPMTGMKRSQSLGDLLGEERGFSCGDDADDDEIVQGYPFDYFHDNSTNRVNESFNDNDSAEIFDRESLEMNFRNNHQEHDMVGSSFDFDTDNVHRESLFSVEVLKQFDGEKRVIIDDQSAEDVSDGPAIFGRSQSETDLRADSASYTEDVGSPNVVGPHSKSFENLLSCNMPDASDADRKGLHHHADLGEGGLLLDTNGGLTEGQDSEGKYWREIFNGDNKLIDGYAFENSNGILNERDEMDAVKINKGPQQESAVHSWDELSPQGFNMKRIEEWISQIDIENGCVVEEPGESSGSFSNKESEKEADVPPTKPDARNNFGMEVAHNYISSLTATSSSAQMANLGLVAVPLLSAFSSLRVLNLSGNAMVRISGGVLPRGLHVLNLSKNSIAAIEGLRDLTRLRVLDLSYNRIVRIGHGLASCSSLKELYLAGNKINEVEGLHRLLKLNILDLRANKISTAKGLGQLAANYGSLQAINLEGNPAQRNVGDEQLRKYVLSLLPNLVYYNKQTIKTSGSKEISDRTARSIVAHQFDRSTRAEHKLPRRGSHGSVLHKASLTNVRSSHAVGSLMKQSKSRSTESRHMHLPPIGSKPTNHLPIVERKMVSLHPNNPIRRIQSEGAL